jgi:uncharacterized repeat protein (TIGR03806 family)
MMAAAVPGWAGVQDAAIAERRPAKLLSAYGFFEDAEAVRPAKGVVRYEIASPLFTDHADKARYVYVPGPVEYRAQGVLEFPVGSALIKTFQYGARKVETRVLLRQEGGWKAYPYVWNEAGDAAVLKLAGANIAVETGRGVIDYRVPNANQCKACHIDASGAFAPIGPKVRNLNTPGQLQRLVAAGVLERAPEDAPATPDYRDDSVGIEARARAYLDANCGHCHAPGLPGDTSGLYLNWEEDRAVHLGIGKHPVAAGRGSGGLAVDIAPGDPDASILYYRMNSVDPGVMMPEIGRSVIDAEGLALIRAYIETLEPR